jgi:hypothetical protein
MKIIIPILFSFLLSSFQIQENGSVKKTVVNKTKPVLLKSFYKLITNKGVGNIKLNHSTLKDVKKEFPKGHLEKIVFQQSKKMQYLAQLTNGESMVVWYKKPKKITKTYTVKKEGISFFFDASENLAQITIWGKEKYKTDKGIILGKSNFSDLDFLYGYTEWAYELGTDIMVKTPKCIRFYPNNEICAEYLDKNPKDSTRNKSPYWVIEKIVLQACLK